MANVKGLVTINDVEILEVDQDPSISPGTPGEIGDLAVSDGIFGVWQKFGSGLQDWHRVDVFGLNKQFALSDELSSTTSTTFQTKLSLTTPSLPLGNYLIQFSYEGSQSNNNQTSEFQILNNAVQISLSQIVKRNTAFYRVQSGFYYLEGISGVHSYYINYRAIGGTALIRRARLAFWRVS